MAIQVTSGHLDDENILAVEVPEMMRNRIRTGIGHFDELFGGDSGHGLGMVPSQVIIFAGTPGAGKTTLLMQIADGLTTQGHICYYNSAEESKQQIKLTAERIGLKKGFIIGQRNQMPDILGDCDMLQKKYPDQRIVLITDSLQAISDGRFATGRITSRTAEENIDLLVNYAKDDAKMKAGKSITAIAIGQTTKEGKMAGANALRHKVDTFMEMSILEKTKDPELEPFIGMRILEVGKNRFGGAGRQSFLRMEADGLHLVAQGTMI